MKMLVPLEVGICCVNLEKLSRFYQDVLGFTFVAQVKMSAEAAEKVGLSKGGYSVSRLQTPYGERIKLLAPDIMPESSNTGLILDRVNTTYLTFIVEDIDALVEQLQSAGATFFAGDAPIQLRPDVKALFCRDPEGNLLELVEYSDITTYRPEIFANRSA
ncbi:VOC family protein [Pseudomonas oryzihabitans]|uniref:VOC family protein n=1 Tax=Pseudomonas oryzihabitans TaxID=47885 RepID=UPI00123A94D3|nr:VOC family protein [Pseudomonas oryzihabitans]QEU01791.1 VOC family protein [Pseudomonas oryzihabitans]